MRILSSSAAALALAVATLVPAVPANAAEQDFLNRFAGSFSGSGLVQRNATEGPNQVTCTLTGATSVSGISMNGQCGAFIFSRNISADLLYDEASGRYTGTYVGSSIGPARLSGKRSGDAVILTITWPQPVNGDTKAVMTIRNSGNGQLGITVTDEITPGGRKADVTRLALQQG